MKKFLLLLFLLVLAPGFVLASSTVSNLTSGGSLQNGDLVYIARSSGTGYADRKVVWADPTAPVNADWSAVSGLAEILNKPTLGTASTYNIGTSGSVVPLLTGVNTFTSSNNFTGGLKSGGVNVLTANQNIVVTGDCSASGTTNLGVVCTKTGGNVFVSSATVDTTNATNISSGTLPRNRLPIATATQVGAISVGSGLTVTASGDLSANFSEYGNNYYDGNGSSLIITTTTAGNFYLVASTATQPVVAGAAQNITQNVTTGNNSLTVTSTGAYNVAFNVSYAASGNNITYHHATSVNGAHSPISACEIKMVSASVVAPCSAGGVVMLNTGDVVTLEVSSDTAGATAAYNHLNLRLHKL